MAQQVLSQVGVLTQSTVDAVNANFTELFDDSVGASVGATYYCDPVNGNDTTGDGTSGKPFRTLLVAYNACVSGKNDKVVLIGNGASSGTARVDAAFTWSKNATHLVGVCSPVMMSQRARIAPTSSTTAFTPFFTISGSGCVFANIQWFHGFATGGASQINIVLSGERNYFKNCHLAGMGDQESADSAGSRSVKIGGSGAGENLFEDCTIGLDTVTRGAANASVEFTGASPRNIFRRCVFPFQADASTPLGYIGSAAGCLDRFNLFDECVFVNGIQSTSTTLSGLGTLPASAGGLLLMKNCTLVGITEFGTDATTRGQVYVDGAAPTAATSGIAVNPT